jgi:DNA-directed RNA polymerase subunit RPC12/RpoP
MQGHVRKRGTASWEYIADIGMAAAQRCSGCGRRFWIERRPRQVCPKCGGRLIETEERRRATKMPCATGRSIGLWRPLLGSRRGPVGRSPGG